MECDIYNCQAQLTFYCFLTGYYSTSILTAKRAWRRQKQDFGKVLHYNSGNLPNVQITEKISEHTERSVYVLSLRLSCTQEYAHKITLFKINTWGCVCWRGRRGLLFDIDKDALRFAERDKNHLGVFRMESKCFYPRVVWKEERGKSRIAVCEDDPLSNAREKSPAIP